MRVVTSLGVVLCMAGAAWAQSFTIDFEPGSGYSVGPLVGQNGWTCCATAASSDSSGFNIVAGGSPLSGGSQSLQVSGVSTGPRVYRVLGTPISTGVYQVGYDFMCAPRVSSNMVMRTIFYVPGHGDQIFQPYAQNGGSPSAAQNGFTDTDGLGSAGYGGTNLVNFPTGYVPNQWYRFEFVMDFDHHTILNLNVYDISTGTKNLLGSNCGPFYFKNDGTNWNGTFGELGFGYDPALSTETWNIDNFSMIASTLPPPSAVPVTPDPDSAFAGVPYSRQLIATSCWDPTLTWAVISGPAGLTVSSTGLVSGWTPASGQGLVTLSVSATDDIGGSATITWHVQVKDPPVLDGSNPAVPWGVMHGDLSATQSSTSMVFADQWANGATPVWSLTVSGGLGERGVITFDEDGNLYFVTIDGNLTSVSPGGSVRWSQAGMAGGDEDGGSAALVGDGGQAGKVYAVTPTGVAAFRKSDGAPQWNTPLTGTNFNTAWPRLTPILYNGLVLVIGSGNTTKSVSAVSAANGELVFTRSITTSLTGDGQGGSVALVPNAFGTNKHGLYFNGDGGSATGAAAYAILVDMTSYSASLAWSAPGGKVARSHIIYSPTTGRLYTPTWADYSHVFYSFNAATGAVQASDNPKGNEGQGWNDFNVLDFNNTDVLSASAGGDIWRYHDNGDGTATATRYRVDPNDLVDYGEERMYGGLYKNGAGDSIALIGTRSNVGNEQVLAFDATTAPQENCASHDDGPVYVDNFKVTFGPSTGTENVQVDTAGFEGYALGDLPGQANPGGTGAITWADDTGGGPSGVGKVQVVNSLPAGGSGKGIKIDATGGCGGWQGVFADFADLTSGIVIVSWDQYRSDLTDNEWVAENIDYSGWYSLGWDQTGAFFADEQNNPAAAMTAGTWQHVSFTFDLGAKTVTANVGSASAVGTLSAGEATTGIRGFDFEVEGTYYDPAYVQPPVVPIFTYPTGLTSTGDSFIRGLQMGPTAAGGRQQIYLFAGSNTLVALGYVRQIPGDFNGDRSVDSSDYNIFLACMNAGNGPDVPVVGAGCAAADLDGDNDVDENDFGLFQRCYTGTGVEGNPDCASSP